MGNKYNLSIIQRLNGMIYGLPFMRKLATKHPFMPQLVWIIPLAIVMMFFGSAGYLTVAVLALYVLYGFYGSQNKKKDINEVQILKPGELVTPENEKRVREYCKDKSFAMALEQHQKVYKAEVERRESLGQNIKKSPYKEELAQWSSETWNEMKIRYEDNLLKLYDLKRKD